MAGKSNRPLIVRTSIDRTGRKRGQACPVASVQRQSFRLRPFDCCSYRSVALVQLNQRLGDARLLPRAFSKLQADIERLGVANRLFYLTGNECSEVLFRD